MLLYELPRSTAVSPIYWIEPILCINIKPIQTNFSFSFRVFDAIKVAYIAVYKKDLYSIRRQLKTHYIWLSFSVNSICYLTYGLHLRTHYKCTMSTIKYLHTIRHFYFIGSWIRFPCLAPFDYKETVDQIKAIQKRAIRIIYPRAYDMPYTSAVFLADLSTMSDRRDQLARKLFKSTIQPTSSLHNFLLPSSSSGPSPLSQWQGDGKINTKKQWLWILIGHRRKKIDIFLFWWRYEEILTELVIEWQCHSIFTAWITGKRLKIDGYMSQCV